MYAAHICLRYCQICWVFLGIPRNLAGSAHPPVQENITMSFRLPGFKCVQSPNTFPAKCAMDTFGLSLPSVLNYRVNLFYAIVKC